MNFEGIKKYRKYLIIMWVIFLLGLFSIPTFFYFVSKGALGKLPTSEKIENPKANLASEVFSADGQLIGKFYTQNRTRIEYEDLSPNIVNALISTEDERYRRHPGIDLEGTFRAIAFLGKRGGGSTITQQLALNLFAKRSRSIVGRIKQKLQEYVVAVQLEKNYTKEEIIALYLNQVDFVNNAVGIKSASNIYFNKEPKDLDVNEAAMIVGMLKNPSLYNPLRREELTKDRRNTVLNQMVRNNKLSTEGRDTLKLKPLGVSYTKVDHIEGLAPYFRSTLAQELRAWANTQQKADGEHYNIYRDGLKIYTTIDSRMQKYAEEAVNEHLREHQKKFFYEFKTYQKGFWKDEQGKALLESAIKQSDAYKDMKAAGATEKEIDKFLNTKKELTVFTYDGIVDTTLTPLDSIKHHKLFLHTGFMVMDPHTGHVKAWVGGIDFETFKYDHANKKTKRLAGSTFKPILYSLAVDNGWSPCMKIPNLPVTIITATGEGWTPANAGNHKYGDPANFTLKQCLATSTNTCAAYIMKDIGPDAMVEQAKRMGMQSNPVPVPSLALGTTEVSLWEMMHIYSTFVNAGSSTQPIYISKIEDKNGTVIEQFITESKKVMSEQTAHIMLEMLKGVTNPGLRGTATRVKWEYKLPGDIAGKTGTTNDHTDGWFMGLTPNLIGGAWVGCDDQALRFHTLGNGSGGKMAMPIWAKFFQKAFKDKELGLDPEATFFMPKVPIEIELDCDVYNVVTPADGTSDPADPFETEEGGGAATPTNSDLEDEFE